MIIDKSTKICALLEVVERILDDLDLYVDEIDLEYLDEARAQLDEVATKWYSKDTASSRGGAA